jgi:hypothetical protein
VKEIDYTQTVLDGLLKAKTYSRIMLNRCPTNKKWKVLYKIIKLLYDFLEKEKNQEL